MIRIRVIPEHSGKVPEIDVIGSTEELAVGIWVNFYNHHLLSHSGNPLSNYKVGSGWYSETYLSQAYFKSINDLVVWAKDMGISLEITRE